MNAKLLSILTTAAAIVTALAAIDLNGLANLIPGDAAATTAWISGGLTTLLIIIRALGDLIDDGKPNGSFKCPAAIFLAAMILALGMTSCGTPVSISYADPSRGLGLGYSSKGGLGIGYVVPSK